MRLRRLRSEWPVAIALLLLFSAIALQARIGIQIWGSDLAGMDEAGHYATGAMVYEYLRHGLFSNPLVFAQNFYLRFPKVAFGHWPPVYYLLQAAAYSILGPTIRSARVLSVLICACCAALLFQRMRRIHGPVIAILCAACFLALPLVQLSSWQVMSDLLVALFMLLATFSFADFLDSARVQDAALFAVWSALAILSKGSGWALGIFMFLAPLLARRVNCFRNKWFWLFGIAVLLVSAPFYLAMRRMNVGYPIGGAQMLSASSAISSRIAVSIPAFHTVPLLVLLIALAGAIAVIRRGQTVEAAALAIVLAQFLFQIFLPLTDEARYYMPSLAAGMLLLGRGLLLTGRTAGPVALTAACLVVSGSPASDRLVGYRAAVDSIPYKNHGTVMLIGSDSIGEGAFVSERLEHDPNLAGVVLRGSKVLASETWSGGNYRSLFHDPAEVLHYLASVPVQYIAIDSSAPANPHVTLLTAAIHSAPATFVLAGKFPVSGFRRGEICLYENLSARGRPAVVRLAVGSRTVEDTIE